MKAYVPPSAHRSVQVFVRCTWMKASTSLPLSTGVCGMFDGYAYNDLTQPLGTLYQTEPEDVQYGVLSPQGFFNMWRSVSCFQQTLRQIRVMDGQKCGNQCSLPMSFSTNNQRERERER